MQVWVTKMKVLLKIDKYLEIKWEIVKIIVLKLFII